MICVLVQASQRIPAERCPAESLLLITNSTPEESFELTIRCLWTTVESRNQCFSPLFILHLQLNVSYGDRSSKAAFFALVFKDGC